MLHDARISGRDRTPAGDRRLAARQTTGGELVIRWHHDPDTPVRYRIVDIGEGGVRLLSGFPMRPGMSGTAVSILPTGRKLNRMCTVSWQNGPAIDGVFEIGLRFS